MQHISFVKILSRGKVVIAVPVSIFEGIGLLSFASGLNVDFLCLTQDDELASLLVVLKSLPKLCLCDLREFSRASRIERHGILICDEVLDCALRSLFSSTNPRAHNPIPTAKHNNVAVPNPTRCTNPSNTLPEETGPPKNCSPAPPLM
jgi:hypothetical protein